MAYPDNLLARGERVIVNKNPHWKVLVLPVVFFLLIVGGGIALLVWLQNWQYFHIAWIAIAVLMLVGLIWLVVVPVIRWRTEHFAISNHHVFFRTGLLSRREHQIPLGQIANMETEVTFWGRLMGYGTLVVESSADQPLKFHNIAELPKTQATLNQLIRDEREAHSRGRWGDDDIVEPEVEAPVEHGRRSHREATYLDDERDRHPEPASTPTRVFGAAGDDTRREGTSSPGAGQPDGAGQPYGTGHEQGVGPQYGGAQQYGAQPQYGTGQQYGGSSYGAAPTGGRPQYDPSQYDPSQYDPAAPRYEAPPQAGQPPYGVPPQSGQPQQYGAPQQPQYGAPQQPQYGAPQHSGQPQPQYGAPQAPSGLPHYGQRPYDPSDPPTDPWLNRPAGPGPNRPGTTPSGTDGADRREP